MFGAMIWRERDDASASVLKPMGSESGLEQSLCPQSLEPASCRGGGEHRAFSKPVKSCPDCLSLSWAAMGPGWGRKGPSVHGGLLEGVGDDVPPLPCPHDSSLANWVLGAQSLLPSLLFPVPGPQGPAQRGLRALKLLPEGVGGRELSQGALSGLIIQTAYLFHSSCEADRLSWQGGREVKAWLMAGSI